MGSGGRRRVRGVIVLEPIAPEIEQSFLPLTLALSPRGKCEKLENRLRGRGDDRRISGNSFLNA